MQPLACCSDDQKCLKSPVAMVTWTLPAFGSIPCALQILYVYMCVCNFYILLCLS